MIILGIESSCDDTACAVLKNDKILSNIAASQAIHEQYGGVVPELAGRSHQQNIVPVVHEALKQAAVKLSEIDAVAFTRGPGLIGSLLVGASFAKSLSLALNVPLIDINHMQAHILAHFVQLQDSHRPVPQFPFLCLTVSGGHTQLVRVNDYFDYTLIGETIDDAAGEAFDKGAKILGLPYPGGPLVDKYAKNGNTQRFSFARPKVSGYDFSFSGLKTSLLYFVRDADRDQADFVKANLEDICASYQQAIIDVLMDRLRKAAAETGITHIALAGGVSANSGLRQALTLEGAKKGWSVFIPPFSLCTDNAAMIAGAGYFRYTITKATAGLDIVPQARMSVGSDR